MMLYPEIPIPPRSEHLWRYTPWKRIHPTKVVEMPKSDEIKISLGTASEMESSDEIGRSFIHSISNICKEITLNNESKELDLRCSGHICSGELKIISTGDSSLIIRISGDSGWSGIRIIGDAMTILNTLFMVDLSRFIQLFVIGCNVLVKLRFNAV